MKTYVLDIIPKIQRLSKELDNITLLTNQHWVVLNELTNSKTVYIFRKSGELLIAINGKVDKAKWEYLGHNSILIDLKDQSYLFKHGFFDEVVLALKLDSKDEYAVLINESKYNNELNSISSVINFLNHKYLLNPKLLNNQLVIESPEVISADYLTDGYTFKMGSFKKFLLRLSNGHSIDTYQKKSDGKFFIYTNNEILLFPDLQTCINYIEGKK